MRLWILPAAILVMVGCKSNEPEEIVESAFMQHAADIAGIYTVTDYTSNDTGCTEGPSALGDLSFTDLGVDSGSFFGAEFVQALGCNGTADCLEALETDLTIGTDAWLFEELVDGDVVGTTVIAFETDGTCEGTVTRSVLSVSGDTLTIREESVEVSGFGLDADGFCDTDAGAAAAANGTCSGLRVLTATFSESL